jgi:hypothetical protein
MATRVDVNKKYKSIKNNKNLLKKNPKTYPEALPPSDLFSHASLFGALFGC